MGTSTMLPAIHVFLKSMLYFIIGKFNMQDDMIWIFCSFSQFKIEKYQLSGPKLYTTIDRKSYNSRV